ncbi:MAG: hypothetical protein CMF12_06850 [Idiomarina sp.]|uniref:hypothetical protein n=1 Tax=Idiomarina sp. TaxID=1874361 RepID=UPI000C3B3E15|nr:hypothetical protein [Idiomarina sp.]MBT42228.1 hypothetical protein [Idiomarina sp.]
MAKHKKRTTLSLIPVSAVNQRDKDAVPIDFKPQAITAFTSRLQHGEHVEIIIAAPEWLLSLQGNANNKTDAIKPSVVTQFLQQISDVAIEYYEQITVKDVTHLLLKQNNKWANALQQLASIINDDDMHRLYEELLASCKTLDVPKLKNEYWRLTELTRSVDSMVATSQKNEQRLAESEEENELLLLQLQQVQEELEQTFNGSKQDKTQIEQLKKQLHDVKTEYDIALSEIETLTTASNGATAVEEENELLLLQLQQVQEELEHYFTQYQALTEQHNNQPKMVGSASSSSLATLIRLKQLV